MLSRTIWRASYPGSDAGMEVRLSKLGLVGNIASNPMEAFVFGVTILAAMVLLAACANLASLMTARAADRAGNCHSRVHRRKPRTHRSSTDDGIGISGGRGRRRGMRLGRTDTGNDEPAHSGGSAGARQRHAGLARIPLRSGGCARCGAAIRRRSSAAGLTGEPQPGVAWRRLGIQTGPRLAVSRIAAGRASGVVLYPGDGLFCGHMRGAYSERSKCR